MSSENTAFQPELSPRLQEWREGVNIPPVTLMISPTDRCNHSCPECIGGRVGTQNLINMSEIVGQVADYGVSSIVFSGGGEPLLNSETPAAIEIAHSKGMEVGLITNGSVPLPETKLLQVLRNCVLVRISMDAANPQQYEYSHGLNDGAFHRMLTNVKQIVEVKEKYGIDSCQLGAGFLTDEITKCGMVTITQICKELGLDFVKFRPFFGNRSVVDQEFAELRA